MSFDEFLLTYPVADWILNVFKTVSPTLIALLTIWINSKREKKKDTEREKKEREKGLSAIKIKYSEEIREDVLHLNSMVWDTGKELLEAIQHVEDKDVSEVHFSAFYENDKAMLVEARRINGKADICVAATGEKQFAFLDLFQGISSVSYKFLDVLQEYNQKANVTSIKEIETLFDEAQTKLIDITSGYEDRLIRYCVELNKACSEN